MQVKYGGFWGVSGWCLRVSGSVWMVSEDVRKMSGVCRCLINWNQLNKYHDNQILLFLPVAACRPNMGVSDGCLDGVWGCLAVSGWYLSVSGRCLGWVDVICSAKNTQKQRGWVKMTPKNTKKGQKTQKQLFLQNSPTEMAKTKIPSCHIYKKKFGCSGAFGSSPAQTRA